MSNETAGGDQIADTGDYNECVCPKCIVPDGDYEQGMWRPVADIPEPKETSAATGSVRDAHE